MAARKRKSPRALAEVSSEHASSSPLPDDDHQDANSPPFFNTTFAIYRASPFYIGQGNLDQRRLEDLSRRLRDTLVGDVVRGIQIGLEATETPWGQVGPLKEINFRWFEAKDMIGDKGEDVVMDGTNDDATLETKPGLWLEIQHDNAAYHALMLPGNESGGRESVLNRKSTKSQASWSMIPGEDPGTEEKDESTFVDLPLLLLRMPAPLQKAITEWLSSMFDCHISKMNMGTKTIITSVWESWIQTAALSEGGPDITITLAFHLPELNKQPSLSNDESDVSVAGLRTMDVSIAPKDLGRFARAGTKVPLGKSASSSTSPQPWDMGARQRHQLAGGNSDDGWAWLKEMDRRSQPFTEALAAYLDHHLALNLFHPSVRVTQISCDGFVLAQAKLKIVRRGEMTEDLSRAAWAFVRLLGDRARGAQVASVF